MANTCFTTLPLSQAMQDTLKSLDYAAMTLIQAKALPVVLEGKDVLAKAKTGSGKTATFAIGLLSKLKVEDKPVQALVLCPTRELAEQVTQEIRRLARFIPNVRVLTLCGGRAFKPQADSLDNGAHIIVGTPGRLLDHLQRNTLKLGKVDTLVLDEADRMLEMGFQEAMDQIIAATPKQKQTLLFSATYSDDIKSISRKIQKKAVEVSVESTHESNSIDQLFYEIKKHERNSTLLGVLQHYKPNSTLIFCNTKAQCKEVAMVLKEAGFQALAIHGDLEQKRRDQILIQFANHSCSILVATDVAARGLDIENLEAVINYEIARTPDTHIHRVGRTGRAGSQGVAISLYLESEQYKLNAIEAYQKSPVICDVPASLDFDPNYSQKPSMKTLCINGGKKQKLRPGDLLGALTGDIGLKCEQVGKINIGDYYSYVAIEARQANRVCKRLATGKIKGRQFKTQLIT